MARRIKELFVSYSRDDKHWTYEFAKALREDLTYSPFVDYRSVHVGTDWWRTICEHIESCDCVVYVMTPKSTESIYCRAEIEYAFALNKPILPLMLKDCTFPADLAAKRVQYLSISDEMQIDRVLLELQKGIAEVQHLIYEGEYESPNPLPLRPPEPKPNDTKTAEEVFDLAAEAAEDGHLEQAEQLFGQVAVADRTGRLGKRALERLEELRSYMQVARRANKPATLRDARKLWHDHVAVFGDDFDPLELSEKLTGKGDTNNILSDATARAVERFLSPTVPPKPKPLRPSSEHLLPAPFAWIDIPGDKGKNWPAASYKIAKYPITNAQFKVFIDAGGYGQNKWWTAAGWQQREEDKWTEPRYWKDAELSGAEQPVVGVSWYEAVAFCLWLSEATGEQIMLPTEKQWQYAAQGDDGRNYPWGNDWDCRRCNNSVSPCESNSTTPVRQYEGKGDSPFGAVDMAGNVWEWCLTDYETKTNDLNSAATDRVVRGGSWYINDTHYFRCDSRFWFYPHFGFSHFGFRISRS
ncbi:MAG: SUMF1/EgtB/PvdO family nonheme iron enzyme [Chloroflexi bacterium]|nr:SUMF1/EgtB/PvdO family nonheme iron enzyme [Chloroflexota bacterium]